MLLPKRKAFKKGNIDNVLDYVIMIEMLIHYRPLATLNSQSWKTCDTKAIEPQRKIGLHSRIPHASQ